MEKIRKDIQILKEICDELKENYSDDEWGLSVYQEGELYRITGLDCHDWDDCNLAHFIDGMQRVLYIQGGG